MAASSGSERDPLVVCLEQARQSAQDLQKDLEHEQHALAQIVRMRREGTPASRLLAQAHALSFPESLTDPTERFGEVIHDCRAQLIRCLVDEEGWTLTQVARKTGHARQLVSRLYHSTRMPEERPGS